MIHEASEQEEDGAQEETKQPPFISRHLVYSVLPFVIIIGSLLVGKSAVDYLSGNSPAPKDVEITVTAMPTPANVPTKVLARATGVPVTKMPTTTPSPRPTDPIVNDTQRKYSNAQAGIEFLYPKEWTVSNEYFNPNVRNQLNLDLNGAQEKNPKEIVSLQKNPIEVIRNVSRRNEEDIAVDGKNAKLSVSAYCDDINDKDGLTCSDGYGSVDVFVSIDTNTWFFSGFTITKVDNMEAAVQQMKDFLSTVKFL